MNSNAINLLEFNKIKDYLKKYAMSDKTKDAIDEIVPSNDISKIKIWMNETTEARHILNINSSIPIPNIDNVVLIKNKLNKGIVFRIDEFICIKCFLEHVHRIKKFMAAYSHNAPIISAFSYSMSELDDLLNEIKKCIVNGKVNNGASNELLKIRKRIIIFEDRIKQKLHNIISSSVYAGYLQENVISIRSGRCVLSVKKEYRKKFPGNILDVSSSGSTIFVEPIAVAKLQEELSLLKIEEEKEVYRILATLSLHVDNYYQEISANIQTILNYDLIFSKAKLSKEFKCYPVDLNTNKIISIKEGRHPLLGKNVVPLDFNIGEHYQALIITGPNAGGKTVAIKTIGLLSLMAQAGLHLPVGEGSKIPIFNNILVDIGDGQSIENSLSTFSAHIENILFILKNTDEKTLVIMDELGAGTDPGEGMGFAIAVLEEIFTKGAIIVATTHLNDIKEFASKRQGFQNGCMEFDIDQLKPLYRLNIGQSGKSRAFEIALKLGIEKRIIERAYEITYLQKR